jgi:hypothetical protein
MENFMQQQPSQQQNSFLGFSNIQAGFNFAEALAGFFSQTTEVYWHKPDAGERYHNFLGMFGKTVTYGVLLTLSVKSAGQLETLPLSGFFFGSFLLTGWNHWRIYRRNQRGERWHSRYCGTPRLASLLPFDHYTLRRWVEPLLSIAGGFAIASLFNQALGGWLVLAGTSQAVTEKLAEMRYRTMILDMMDKDIEARNLRAAIVEQKDARQTEGFVIPVGGLNPNQRAGVFRGLAMQFEEWREAFARQRQQTPPLNSSQAPYAPTVTHSVDTTRH